MRPFPICPLYTQAEILSLDKPIADCFLFRPRKSCEKRKKRSHTNVSNASVTRSSTPPAQTAHVCFHGRDRVHTRLRSKNRTQRLTHRNRGLPDGAAITTLGAFRTFANLPGPGVRTANFAAFGSWSGGLPKNTESLGTAMRLCVSLFRGVAAPLGCVIFFASAEIAVCTSCAQGFLRVRGMGGITTLGVLCVLLKRRTAACQSGSFAVF